MCFVPQLCQQSMHKIKMIIVRPNNNRKYKAAKDHMVGGESSARSEIQLLGGQAFAG